MIHKYSIKTTCTAGFDKLPGEISYEYGKFQVLLKITVELATTFPKIKDRFFRWFVWGVRPRACAYAFTTPSNHFT